jgi:hypothetical protein
MKDAQPIMHLARHVLCFRPADHRLEGLIEIFPGLEPVPQRLPRYTRLLTPLPDRGGPAVAGGQDSAPG